MHAFIYTRVSSSSQDNNSNGNISLRVQQEMCKEYADRKSYDISIIKSDVVSARSMSKQKGLNSLVKHIINRKSPSVLLVSNASRFSRCTLEGLQLLERLRKSQCTVIFVQERLEYNSVSDKQSMRFLLSNSEFESDMISQRVRASFQLKKSLGSKLGVAPYGYTAVRSDDGIRSFVRNEEEQKVITFICEAHKCQLSSDELTELMSDIKGEDVDPILFYDDDDDIVQTVSNIPHSNIAQLLNDYDVTKRGKEWTPSMVNYIIKQNQDEVTPITNRISNVRL